MRILALNAGSNSLKFEICEVEPGEIGADKASFGTKLVSGSYDNIGKDGGTFTLFEGKRQLHQDAVKLESYEHAAELLTDWIEGGGAKDQQVGRLADLQKVGHRVVHGADLFRAPSVIDNEVIRKIESLEDLAPLHNASALDVIRAMRKKVGPAMPMIAVFDTVFHQTIPDEAALYALPMELAQKHKIRRYGFHGISHRYMSLRYGQIVRKPVDGLRLITLHLEGGSSAAAIRNGKSVDTSMGFTPLEGLMMGTRTGDLDPAIVPYLMRKENMDPKAVEAFLNKKCGLLGVSGVSADTRELRKRQEDENVRLALEMFSYRVRKYVGAYLAVLGGANAVIFGGGIGENTPTVRENIATGLEELGLELDKTLNQGAVDCEAMITTPDSAIEVWVIPTEEALMVAHDSANCN